MLGRLRSYRWLIAGGAVVALLMVAALRPKAVGVDVATVAQGPMHVTVDEEGKARVREVFMVSAPISGKIQRAALEPGDIVVANETVLAVIEPTAPAFLDVRSRREAEATISAAKAAVTLAAAEVRKSTAELEFAISDLGRADRLAKSAITSERALEKARLDVDTRRAGLAMAQANLDLRMRELENAEARLIGPQSDNVRQAQDDGCCVKVRAPVGGRVLRRLHESERVVAQGTPLIEIGDIGDLEIVVELLSTDAVKIAAGAQATIEGWGRRETLRARVQRIEPAAFTKVSALGIEEQRVKVILDPVSKDDAWSRLGHEYRVFVRITAWQADDVMQAPLSALFRRGQEWAVFRVEKGRARLADVGVGQRNAEVAEITSGLRPAERLILHPSDRIANGVRVTVRESIGSNAPGQSVNSSPVPFLGLAIVSTD